jgi:hypothetical protein
LRNGVVEEDRQFAGRKSIFASATDAAAILQFPKIMMEVHGDKKDIEVRLKRLGYEIDAEHAMEATWLLYAWRTGRV